MDERIEAEKQRRKGTSTIEHLKLVLSVIDGAGEVPIEG
jgi:hypothetical protein